MRDWWLRALLVLQRPRPVFVALRDESKQSLGDRSEPVLAIVLLAGVALALSSSTAAHLLDDPDYDSLLVAVWAFIAGGLTGGFTYFAFGAILYGAVRLFGSQGTYRRSRHVLAFAAVPLVLSLALWPIKLALYGADLFHGGGHDHGAGAWAFTVLGLLFVAWTLVLLVTGVRSVHGWTWARAGAATGLSVVVPVALGIAVRAF
jgi:hypothetical protein